MEPTNPPVNHENPSHEDPGREDDDLARRIEDGSYFEEARAWYSLLYIGPISQRIFFMVVTAISVLIFLMSVISIMNLMPLSPRIPFLYSAKDITNEHPRMVRLKDVSEASNPALIRYYLSTYVELRESYNARRFQMFRAFVRHYSTPDLFAAYSRETSTKNPRSPIRRFGKQADVKTEVTRVVYSRAQLPYTARVDFSTTVVGKDSESKSDWTASLRFEYTDLIERNNYNEATGEYELDFDEPTFRVVGYEKQERLPVPATP